MPGHLAGISRTRSSHAASRGSREPYISTKCPRTQVAIESRALRSKDLLYVRQVLAAEEHHLEYGQRLGVPDHALPMAKRHASAPRASGLVERNDGEEYVDSDSPERYSAEAVFTERLDRLGDGDLATDFLEQPDALRRAVGRQEQRHVHVHRAAGRPPITQRDGAAQGVLLTPRLELLGQFSGHGGSVSQGVDFGHRRRAFSKTPRSTPARGRAPRRPDLRRAGCGR